MKFNELLKYKSIFFLILLAVITTSYLLVLGYYNSFLLDDYAFIAKVRQQGIFGFISHMYLTWQGRFGAFFLSGLNYKIFENSNLIFMAIFHLLLGYITLFLSLKSILPKLNLFLKWLLAVVITNLMIFGQLAFHIFYWGCTSWYISVNYLLVLSLLMIFSKSYQKTYTYPIFILFLILVGSFAETYSPLVIMCLGTVWLYSFYKKDWLSKASKTRLFVALIVLSVSFILLLIAPGNKVRIQESGGQLPTLDFIFIRKTVSLFPDFLFFILSKIHYLLLLFPVFVPVGFKYKKINSDNSFIQNLKFRHFILSLLGLFIFLYISEIPGVYALKDSLAPMRSFSFLPFVLAFFFAFWGFTVGYKVQKLGVSFTLFYSVFLFLIIGVVMNKFYNDFPVVRDYKTAITERHQIIKENKEKGRIEPLKIKRLDVPKRLSNFSILYNSTVAKLGIKSPKMYYDFCYIRYYLAPDVKDWRNQGLKEYFELDYDIIGWEREPLLYVE